MVVIVAVILVVVMIVIVRVVIIVVFIRIVVVVILLACSIPISWAYAFHQDKASSVRVPVANVTLSSLGLIFPFFASGVPVGPGVLFRITSLAIDAACAFRAQEMPSLISCWMAATLRGYDKDGDDDANGGNDDEGEISWKQ
ncbi:hypothetical protein Tco_0196359 [Tanacetum coccineum]